MKKNGVDNKNIKDINFILLFSANLLGLNTGYSSGLDHIPFFGPKSGISSPNQQSFDFTEVLWFSGGSVNFIFEHKDSP